MLKIDIPNLFRPDHAVDKISEKGYDKRYYQ